MYNKIISLSTPFLGFQLKKMCYVDIYKVSLQNRQVHETVQGEIRVDIYKVSLQNRQVHETVQGEIRVGEGVT